MNNGKVLQLILESFDAIHQRLARIEAELQGRNRKADRALLSLREAACRLGVSRGDTLHELIRRNMIRTVNVNGRVRTPAMEIERLVREGFDISGTSTRKPNHPRPPYNAREEAAKIRRMRF